MFVWVDRTVIVVLNGERYTDVSMAFVIKLAADRSVKK